MADQIKGQFKVYGVSPRYTPEDREKRERTALVRGQLIPIPAYGQHVSFSNEEMAKAFVTSVAGVQMIAPADFEIAVKNPAFRGAILPNPMIMKPPAAQVPIEQAIAEGERLAAQDAVDAVEVENQVLREQLEQMQRQLAALTTAQTAEASVAAVPVPEPEAPVVAVEETPKRGRGRPRKNPEA